MPRPPRGQSLKKSNFARQPWPPKEQPSPSRDGSKDPTAMGGGGGRTQSGRGCPEGPQGLASRSLSLWRGRTQCVHGLSRSGAGAPPSRLKLPLLEGAAPGANHWPAQPVTLGAAYTAHKKGQGRGWRWPRSGPPQCPAITWAFTLVAGAGRRQGDRQQHPSHPHTWCPPFTHCRLGHRAGEWGGGRALCLLHRAPANWWATRDQDQGTGRNGPRSAVPNTGGLYHMATQPDRATPGNRGTPRDGGTTRPMIGRGGGQSWPGGSIHRAGGVEGRLHGHCLGAHQVCLGAKQECLCRA